MGILNWFGFGNGNNKEELPESGFGVSPEDLADHSNDSNSVSKPEEIKEPEVLIDSDLTPEEKDAKYQEMYKKVTACFIERFSPGLRFNNENYSTIPEKDFYNICNTLGYTNREADELIVVMGKYLKRNYRISLEYSITKLNVSIDTYNKHFKTNPKNCYITIGLVLTNDVVYDVYDHVLLPIMALSYDNDYDEPVSLNQLYDAYMENADDKVAIPSAEFLYEIMQWLTDGALYGDNDSVWIGITSDIWDNSQLNNCHKIIINCLRKRGLIDICDITRFTTLGFKCVISLVNNLWYNKYVVDVVELEDGEDTIKFDNIKSLKFRNVTKND